MIRWRTNYSSYDGLSQLTLLFALVVQLRIRHLRPSNDKVCFSFRPYAKRTVTSKLQHERDRQRRFRQKWHCIALTPVKAYYRTTKLLQPAYPPTHPPGLLTVGNAAQSKPQNSFSEEFKINSSRSFGLELNDDCKSCRRIRSQQKRGSI